jgi:hypothetical protein
LKEVIGKPNKSRTCEATTYCRINRTSLEQMGVGHKLKCPVCDAIYDPDYVEPKESKPVDYSEMLYRKYGWKS